MWSKPAGLYSLEIKSYNFIFKVHKQTLITGYDHGFIDEITAYVLVTRFRSRHATILPLPSRHTTVDTSRTASSTMCYYTTCTVCSCHKGEFSMNVAKVLLINTLLEGIALMLHYKLILTQHP